jgi:hypothetical protein
LKGAASALALLVVFAGAIAMAEGSNAGFSAVLGGVVMLMAIRFERVEYKREVAVPPPGFVRTGERVVDGDAVVDVWTDEETGERAYVRREGIFG